MAEFDNGENIMENIKLSIFLLAYNQVNLIRQCLDGVVSQKTNFDFEVIVHDDCSDDGTKEIIEEYAAKYSFIKPIYENENQFQKDNISGVIKKTYEKCSGEYVALLEGDDYWIDENKLQTQVDFLDKNPDFSGCFHKSLRKNIVTGEDIGYKPSVEELKGKDTFTINDTVCGYFIETCSVMYRFKKYKKEFFEIFPKNIVNGDTFAIYFFSLQGKIKYIDKLMSVKTINESGIWNSTKQSLDEKNVRFALPIINFPIIVNNLFKRYGADFPYETPESAMKRVLNSIIATKRFDVIEKIAETFPEVFYSLINLDNGANEINRLKKKIKKYKKRNLFLLIFCILLILSLIIAIVL